MPIYYQSANPIPICGQSVNPLPIRQSLTNLPISDQSIYPMPTLDQADMTVFQPQPLHTHTSATTIETTLSPVQSPILANPMSMHLAVVFLYREQDLYAGPTFGLDGGWFHSDPSRQSAQFFFQSWTIYASLLQILDPPTNAILIYWTMPMSMLHKVTNPLSIYQPMHLSTQPVKSTNPGPSCQFTNAMSIQSILVRQPLHNQANQSKANRLHKLGLIMDWHQLAVHWQMSCQSMMNPSHKAQFT